MQNDCKNLWLNNKVVIIAYLQINHEEKHRIANFLSFKHLTTTFMVLLVHIKLCFYIESYWQINLQLQLTIKLYASWLNDVFYFSFHLELEHPSKLRFWQLVIILKVWKGKNLMFNLKLNVLKLSLMTFFHSKGRKYAFPFRLSTLLISLQDL